MSNSTSTKDWANGFQIIGGLLMIPGVGVFFMIPGVGVFFATGGGISISLIAGVLLLLAGGSLRERARTSGIARDRTAAAARILRAE